MIEKINEILDRSLDSWNTGRDQLTELFDATIKNLYQSASDYGKDIDFSIQNIIDFLMLKIFDLSSKAQLIAKKNDKSVTLSIHAYAYQIHPTESDLMECIIYEIEFDIINRKLIDRTFKPVCILRDQKFVDTCVQLHNVINPGYYTTGQAVSEVPVVETRMFKNQYFTKES